MYLQLTQANRKTLENLFRMNLPPKSDRIGVPEFHAILRQLDCKFDQKMLDTLTEKVFKNQQTIDFNLLLRIFRVEVEDCSLAAMKNAFKFLAKDNDSTIEMSVLENLINSMELSESEKQMILNTMYTFKDKNGKFNYRDLLKCYSFTTLS